MKFMSGFEVQRKFLEFFKERGHAVVSSSSLVPRTDPTLLFTNAGMVQFKDVFLGLEKKPYSRATTAQKCLRVSGKHNDLEQVGPSPRHHTFFIMLGNFSFGDYFKEDAIKYAWDLLLNVYELPLERLWFTVYTEDDEAFELWKKVGAPADRILRFGEKENFWQMGETGPCGPCSEIHFYLGEDLANNTADLVNGPGDENIEIWNLVFMQYNRDESGRLTPLPKPSVDTGMGLERTAAVLQRVRSNYETDLLRPIIDFIARLVGKDYIYESEDGISMRVITDHARATAFLIADGVFPGNEGRAYVLRKIMRRALWHGRKLGLETPFFHKVTEFVADMMSELYPELKDSRGTISHVVTVEEKLFSSTLSAGIRKLDEIIEKSEGQMVAGSNAFVLYDTFGLRQDLIDYIARQRGFTVDWPGFEAELERQRKRARESWKGGVGREVKEVYQKVAAAGQSEFRGYQETETSGARVQAIIVGEAETDTLKAGEIGEIVLDRTPFYAEAGGQVGDTGVIESDSARVLVNDTVSPVSGLIVHKVVVEIGELRVGDSVTARVDAERRDRIRANHTGTHLLHAALREVLGPHVKQAGSLVAPDRLRFDFTHFAPLTPEEIAEIERLVNTEILKNTPVKTDLMDLEEALSSGAMALFDEKYGEKVRVVSIPGFSRELCGGTHTRATGDIGLLKIISDSSIASGTRRIEALTGVGAFERFQALEEALSNAARSLNIAPTQLPQQIERLQEQLKAAQREMDGLKLKLASQAAAGAAAQAREVNGIKVLAQRVENLDGAGRRTLADNLIRKIAPGVVVLGQADGEKAALLVRVSDDLTKRLPAGKIVKELAAIVGGGGGGRADLAEAGGRDPGKLDQALEASYRIVESML